MFSLHVPTSGVVSGHVNLLKSGIHSTGSNSRPEAGRERTSRPLATATAASILGAVSVQLVLPLRGFACLFRGGFRLTGAATRPYKI